MRKHSALALTISLLFLVLEVNAQEMTSSSIDPPTFVCRAGYSEPLKFNSENPIIVINIDADFDALWSSDSEFPQYRYYAIAGGPHASIAGTTPINWLPFARALFIAGDEWVRNGTPPPASEKLNSFP